MKGVVIWGAIILFIIVLSSSSSDSKTENQVIALPSPTPQVKGITNTPITIPQPPYFNGYPCTVDCSGHEAGYKWAEEHDIDDEDDCGGNSDSFIEGCQSYVEENYPEEYNQDSEENY